MERWNKVFSSFPCLEVKEREKRWNLNKKTSSLGSPSNMLNAQENDVND